MLHGIAGAVAEGLGLYLLLLMHSLLPAPLRASNFRLLMRLTFGLWLLVFAGGATMYVTTYTGSAPASSAAAVPGRRRPPLRGWRLRELGEHRRGRLRRRCGSRSQRRAAHGRPGQAGAGGRLGEA